MILCRVEFTARLERGFTEEEAQEALAGSFPSGLVTVTAQEPEAAGGEEAGPVTVRISVPLDGFVDDFPRVLEQGVDVISDSPPVETGSVEIDEESKRLAIYGKYVRGGEGERLTLEKLYPEICGTYESDLVHESTMAMHARWDGTEATCANTLMEGVACGQRYAMIAGAPHYIFEEGGAIADYATPEGEACGACKKPLRLSR